MNHDDGRVRAAVAATLLLGALLVAAPAVAASPNLVVNQLYGGGGLTGAAYRNDFVELFNRGPSEAAINGHAIQYKSATGSTWQVFALPSATIPAGGYYLVQGATNGVSGVDTPPPDTSTTLNASASQGTIALTSSTAPLTCTTTACSSAAGIVDLVGYGVPGGLSGADTYEGSSAAPTTSSSQWIYRLTDGCQDTDNNGGDFASGSLAPRNSATPAAPCPVGPPALTIGNVSVTETESNVTATLPVTLSHATDSTVTVNFATAIGTAKSADFVAKSGTLSFTPGQTQRLLGVTVKGDVLDEATEAFTVTLSSPAQATIADGTGRTSIIDDDPLPALLISNRSVTEGDSGSVAALFTVRLTAVSGRTVNVRWATIAGSALSPSDYAAGAGELTFPAGTVRRTVTVAVKGDRRNEPDESFTVRLSSPVNASFADRTGRGTIVDDD